MDAETPILGVIENDDFAKLDLRVGKVLEVADHPNADKLLVMKVDIGGEQRQLIAGLRPYCSHEQLLASQVIVVANLAPRKMRGLESQGMILAASWVEGQGPDEVRKVVPLSVSMPTPAGAKIS
jgi:methionine--tRNA ligase beta chain